MVRNFHLEEIQLQFPIHYKKNYPPLPVRGLVFDDVVKQAAPSTRKLVFDETVPSAAGTKNTKGLSKYKAAKGEEWLRIEEMKLELKQKELREKAKNRQFRMEAAKAKNETAEKKKQLKGQPAAVSSVDPLERLAQEAADRKVVKDRENN